jgi:hypothetical protein
MVTAERDSYPEPLSLSGALDKFDHEETTPAIGREFLGVNIVEDILNASNADELLRDLAITSPYSPTPFSLINPPSDFRGEKKKTSLRTRRSLLPQTRQSNKHSPKTTRTQTRPSNQQTLNLNPTHPPRPQRHQR